MGFIHIVFGIYGGGGGSDTYAITGIHLYLAMRQQLDLEAEMRQELNNTGVYLGGEDN